MFELSGAIMEELKLAGTTARTYFQINHATLQAAILSLFALVNSVRVLAYIPQIVKTARDQNGASAISYTTWGLFFASHVTTIAYAVVCVGDPLMAVIFFGNALACLAIVAVTYMKRRNFFGAYGARRRVQ